jgi:acetoin utilization deacetylase AcuC-like enzyme
LDRIKEFGAEVVVVSLGLDPLRGDPVQSPEAGLQLDPDDYVHMGRLLDSLQLPLLFVQEGGYELDKVPIAAQHLLVDGFTQQS